MLLLAARPASGCCHVRVPSGQQSRRYKRKYLKQLVSLSSCICKLQVSRDQERGVLSRKKGLVQGAFSWGACLCLILEASVGEHDPTGLGKVHKSSKKKIPAQEFTVLE